MREPVTHAWPEATPNRVDGLRLDWPDRWVHVRPSNTEPIVRVIAEAPKASDAAALCKEVGALLQDWLKSLRAQGSVRMMTPGEVAP